MTQRRFGPTTGAGVAVVEMDADKILEPAPLGVTAYIGVLKRGDLNKLISTYSKRQMLKKVGGVISGSQVGDAAIDFWDHSGGAGELHFIRVTDGTEAKASRFLYSRETIKQPVVQLNAKNGGRWGGKHKRLIGSFTANTETTMSTGLTMKADEWAGARLTLKGVAAKTYEVVSNTIAGVVTVKADSTMETDLGVSADTDFILELERDLDSEITVEIGDGEVDPATLFSLTVFVDGGFVKKYPNLSMDPASRYYFVRVINDDDANDELEAVDLNNGSTPPARRPANEAGVVSAVAQLVLTCQIAQVRKTGVTVAGATPAVALGATTDAMYADRIEITMTAATTFTAKSLDVGGGLDLGNGTLGVAFTPNHPNLPPFTLTNAGTAMVADDKFIVDYTPMAPDALIGGVLYPNKGDSPLTGFRISDNDHKTITVSSGDLTGATAIGKQYMVTAKTQLMGGHDGGTPLDAHYTKHFDANTSKLNGLIGQNKGLVKLGTPGITATAVAKAGLAYAEAKNWQYRVEVPANIVTEDSAINHINVTVGRNDFGVTAFPSFADVNDPLKPGIVKSNVTLTGAIHGREAAVAKAFDGYHKAAAGVDVTLPRIVKLPTGDTVLNEEVLNPQGLNVVKKSKGNYILWGDRSISIDPTWKFKHQRELMSHYENRLREGFDWIVFAINDPAEQQNALTTLKAFFKPEHAKRAIRGATLEDAVSLKAGDDINTDASRAEGDLYAEIKLRLADTVERFVMRVGKAGIFESLSA